jgi:competence protein ComEA
VVAAGGWTQVAACGDPRDRAPLRGPVRRLFGLALDPNTADARALESLPGIGPARAAAIVRERGQRPYATVSELRRVPGIGPVTLGRIAPHLAIGGADGWHSSETGSLPRPVVRGREGSS